MKKIIVIIQGLFVLVVQCTDGLASEGASSPDLAWMTVRMLSVLACILGAILFALYIIKRMKLQQKIFPVSHKCIQLLETLYLGPKRSIALVKAGNEFLVVGLSPNQITFLTKIDPPPELYAEVNKEKHQSFSEVLTKARNDQGIKGFYSSSSMNGKCFQAVQKLMTKFFTINMPPKQKRYTVCRKA